MNFNKVLKQLQLGLILILLSTVVVVAQNKQSFRLIDKNNSLPIQTATFEYGEQNGVSDINGNISFVFKEGYIMRISHINYGEWILESKIIQSIIKDKVYYRSSISVSLFPVSVIAMHSNQMPQAGMKLEYQDKMVHDGAEVLNQLPALNSIRKSGSYGADPVFRGFKYDQLNIVLNGVQGATAACPNRMDPPTSQMAPNMLDRIEVLKGPHALRYGTGFGATINFVPSKLRFSDEQDVYGRASSGYQSNGEALTTEAQLGFNGNNYDVSFFGAWAQGNDYESGNGQTIQSDYQRGSFGANFGFKLFAKQQLRVSTVYNMARDVDFPALPMDLRKDDTYMMSVRHDIQIDKDHLKSWNTAAFASIVDHSMDNLLKPLDPRNVNATTPAHTFNYGGRTEGNWDFEKGALFAGVDFRAEGAKGSREREFLMGTNAGKTMVDNAWQESQINKTGLFGEYHLNNEKFQFVFSARVELNSAEIKDASDEFTQVYSDTKETQLNPSFSVGVSHNYSKGIKWGVWLGRAQRSAGLTERFINYFPVGQDPYEMLGNPLLDPEKNNQLDLTFEYSAKKTQLNVDVFYAYLQDFISSVIDPSLMRRMLTSPGVRQFTNIDKAFKTGFEINWSQQLARGLQQQIGIAYTYAQDLEKEEPLPEVAPLDFRYVLKGSYFKDKFQPEASFRHVLEQTRISEEFGESESPSFSLVDIKLSYQISNAFRFSGGVNNLFDTNYYEHLSRAVKGTSDPIFAPGRNVFASLNISF